MRGLKFLILGVAIVAGVGAVALVKGELDRAREAADTTPIMVPAPPPMAATQADVLVVSRELKLGETIRESDLRWQPWPQEAVSEAFVTRAESPDADESLIGAVVRSRFAEGEPVTDSKLLRINHPGVLSTMIRDGLRAFAIAIAPETGAGGFVLPGDFVDLILTREEVIEEQRKVGEAKERSITITETLVRTVRVMAVDTVLDAEGESAMAMKRTVTLEVTPQQAELLSMAEQIGRITLALRGVAELVNDQGEVAKDLMPELAVDPRTFDPRFLNARLAGDAAFEQPADETADAGKKTAGGLGNEILILRGSTRQRTQVD